MDEHNIPWERQINSAPWPNIHLDFELIEKAGGLTLNEDMRKRVEFISNSYKAFKEQTEKIRSNQSTTEIRRKIQSISTASKSIAEAISDYSYGENSPDGEAARIIYSFLDCDTLDWIEPSRLASFLENISMIADRLKEVPAPRGPKRDEQKRLLIQQLHHVFLQIGGKGRGCFVSTAKDSGYAGPFHALVCEILRQIDIHAKEPGLGKMICSMFDSSGKKIPFVPPTSPQEG